MLLLFVSAFIVGLSGAMMPGPLLTYTIRKSLSRGPKSGFIVTAGHAVLELCLIAVILLGFDIVLKSEPAQIGIGIVGGILLGFMGVNMIVGSVKNRISVRTDSDNPDSGSMFISGIVLSAANPYFLLWWAVVGLGFIMQAYGTLGFAGAAAYYLGHISADFIWYGIISVVVGTTRRFIKEAPYRVIIAFLGCLLVFFGVSFVFRAGTDLINIIRA